MMLRWIVASIHLLALALGAAGIFMRARSLRNAREPGDLRAVFLADNLWGIASLLWLSTGVWRAFGGLEKGTDYYSSNPLFHIKFSLFFVVGLLEIQPAVNLFKWRRAVSRGESIDLGKAKTFARISHVQLAIIVVMVFLATAIARGIGIH